MRFIAIASVSCASAEIEPYDIAPVEKRCTIASTGSTSSMSIGSRSLAEPEQPAQRRQVARLVVDLAAVLLEDVVALGPRRVLQLEHGLRVEQVVLALAAPLVLAAELELAVGPLLGSPRVGDRVPDGDLGGDARRGRCRRCG